MASATRIRATGTHALLSALVILLSAATHHALARRDSLPDGAARHAVLVVFDTLRADRLSLYGHKAKTSPYLEEASREFLRYGSVRATAPWTVPSHASMFTGLWPAEHKAQWGNLRLAESLPTLAGILSNRGFCTVGLSANDFVSSATGLDRGFDGFKVLPGATGPEILREVEDVLDHVRDCHRWFLFINLMDTHVPYNFRPYAAEFGASHPPILSAADEWAVNSGERVLTGDEAEQHRRAYDAAVRVIDDFARQMIGMLRQRGLLDDTLAVLTSDHGEGLARHGEMGHVLSVREAQLAVPLVVRLPGARRGGESYERRVSLVGLTPSILDWLAVPRPAELVDRPNLEQTADGPIIADYRGYFSENDRIFNQRMRAKYPKLAARISAHHVTYCDDYKLVVSPGGRDAFYDIVSDPRERNDLVGADSTQLKMCLARYDEEVSAGLFSPFDGAASGPPMSKELIKLVKSLGYLQ